MRLSKLVPKHILTEGKSLYHTKVGPFALSVIMRGSSSLEAPQDYKESMIWTVDSAGKLDQPKWQSSGDWSERFKKLRTQQDVESFLKKMDADD